MNVALCDADVRRAVALTPSTARYLLELLLQRKSQETGDPDFLGTFNTRFLA